MNFDRQPPSLGKINTTTTIKTSPKTSINLLDKKLDQNNNAANQETSSTINSESTKQYDSNHSEDDEPDEKKQNKRGVSKRRIFFISKFKDLITFTIQKSSKLKMDLIHQK